MLVAPVGPTLGDPADLHHAALSTDSPQARRLERAASFSSNPETESWSLTSPALAGGSSPLVHLGSPTRGSESLIFTHKPPNCVSLSVFFLLFPICSYKSTLLSLSLNQKKFHPKFLSKLLPLLESFISHLRRAYSSWL